MLSSSGRSPQTERNSRWSIRGQLYLLFAASFLFFVLAVAFMAYQQTRSEQEEVGKSALQLAAITAADAERFLQDSEQLLARLAQRPLVRALDARRCDPAFRDFRDLQPRYENVSTFDLMGRPICAAAPPSEEAGILLDMKESVERIAREQKFVVGKIKPGSGKGKWILPLSYPLKGDDGKLAGIITLAVDLDRFPPLAARARGPDQTVVAIDDGEGTVVGRRTEPDKAGDSGNDAETRKPSTAKVRNADGFERIYGYLPILGTEWKALVGIPTDKLGLRVLITALRYLVLGIAIFAVIGVAALYLRRRLDRPLKGLVDAVRSVGSGQPPQRAPEDVPVEFADVSREFNAMLDALARDRKTVEEVETKLQDVLRAAGGVVYSITPGRDRILFLSATADRVYGRLVVDFYTNAALWFDSVHEDDRENVQAQYKQLLRGGTFDIEYRIVRHDGALRWMHDRAWLINDEAGRPARIDGFALDTSNRKQVDLTLRSSLQHFRAIAEASPVPLCVTNCADGIIRYANDAFLQAFDVAREACIGQELASLCANRDDLENLLQRLVREGNVDAEMALRRHDGTILWVAATTRLSTYDTEPAVYIALYDVTARKQAEHSLRAAEDRFRTLIAALAEGVVLVDGAGRIVSCNSAAEDILGMKREQLLGLMLGSPRWQPVLEDGTALSRHTHPAAVTLATGKPQRGTVVGVQRPDGDQIWLSINTEPQFHPDSTRPYSVVVSFLDITARKLIDQAVEQSSSSNEEPFASATDAIVSVDQQRCITFFNHLAQRMFGFDAGEMLGRSLDTLIAERDRAVLAEHLANVGFGSRAAITISGLAAEGREIPLEAKVSKRNFGDHMVFTIILRKADTASSTGSSAMSADRKRRSHASAQR